ncbi:Hypothetical Protein FCC1311_001242 [Hondaea fermentalgiana]|uniref:Uncharacterized protein n=1 Tax=Hondaea fermentalgiana TaxID=2315210 RepID=A0A2R5G056_9STRA|nr:Hypothetical Protein FCC1311_001242 [Hondaea fermentalgiana]|eukprot:GBG23905.1 Hypothetical Protein FCC1311_001242 [Hondaea fermentalgiana]
MLLLLQIVLASVVFATVIGFVKNMFTYKASVHPRPQPIVPVPPRFDLQAASVRRQQGQQQDQGHRPARQTPSPRLNRPADRVRSAQLVGQGQEQLRLRQQQQQQQQLENHHESNQDLSYMERLLRTGCLLKATRANAVFAGATVLLESVDTSHETHGVVLNRELQGPALESARSVSRAVVDARAWIGRGGPHANNVVTVVHEAPALPGASQLGNGVCIGHYATLRHLEVDPAEVTRRNPKLRVLLGRVRWPNAEQLVSEIRQGLWNVSSTQATTQNTFVDCRSPRSATH